MGTLFGIVLPGVLAPASDVLIGIFVFNLLFLGWLLRQRQQLLRAEEDLLQDPDWTREMEKGWEVQDKQPAAKPTIDAFAETADDEESEPVSAAPPAPELPPRATCSACRQRLMEADMWARCLGCGTHYHTLCLGRLGSCGSCGNPVEGLEVEEEASKTDDEGDEA